MRRLLALGLTLLVLVGSGCDSSKEKGKNQGRDEPKAAPTK
jgi:hypothetical protein